MSATMDTMPQQSRAELARHRIIELIRDGESGARMPSESDLAALIGVSRGTVRDALHRLWLEGSVVRRWGAGTFIAESTTAGTRSPFESIYVDVGGLRSLREQIEELGGEPSLQHFSAEDAPAPAWVQAEAGLTGPMWKVQRWLSIDAVPAIVLNDYVPRQIAGSPVDPAALGDLSIDISSFLRVLGVRVVKQQALLEPVSADHTLAAALDLAEGAPLIRSRQKTISERGEVIIASEVYYRSETFGIVLVRSVAD